MIYSEWVGLLWWKVFHFNRILYEARYFDPSYSLSSFSTSTWAMWLYFSSACRSHIMGWSHSVAMFASRPQWTIWRNVSKRSIYTSTSQNVQAAYIVTFPSTYKSNWNNVTETSQHTPRASFSLLTYTCYVYERSVTLFIVDGKQAWQRCGIDLYCALDVGKLSIMPHFTFLLLSVSNCMLPGYFYL